MKNKIILINHTIRVRDTQGNISYIEHNDAEELLDLGDSEHTDVVNVERADKRFEDYGGKPY